MSEDWSASNAASPLLATLCPEALPAITFPQMALDVEGVKSGCVSLAPLHQPKPLGLRCRNEKSMSNSPSKGTALVTGASAGIGAQIPQIRSSRRQGHSVDISVAPVTMLGADGV